MLILILLFTFSIIKRHTYLIQSVICMSLDLYSLNRSIDDEDAIEFRRKAILYDKSDVNKLVHDFREKLNHFCAKAILFMVLRDLKHDVTSEVEIVDVGIGDLFDITTNVLYEFETTGSKKVQKRVNEIYKQTGVEIIVIDVKELPDDIFQRCMKLKEYVIPD